uniref:Uncharacterized protein n=1 Tax=Acrobeloides nanus TaxID=290746 RepID=A0A914E3B5_9BILA
MNPELFPPPDFAPDAPECTPEREPCGWYSFSLNERSPFRWQKSWCRCSDKHLCVYDATNMKMKVYKQVCKSKEKLCREENNDSRDMSY